MRAFLDTSVLVPVFAGDHVHHSESLELFAGLNRSTGSCAAHSLAEVYATLTRMPGRMSPDRAMMVLASVQDRLTVVALTAAEYGTALESAAGEGIAGATIYDALIAHCALKSGAMALYTWNQRHFAQCGSEIARRLQQPTAH